MADVVDKATRSRMMSNIKGRNTAPEKLIRSGLHMLGFRFRINDRTLKGSPDIVLRRWSAVIFVHGCFWHGHGCPTFKMPRTRREFWVAKIGSNKERDAKTVHELRNSGWRVCIIWECVTRKSDKGRLATRLERWLRGKSAFLEIDR
jgi:DNA mismatch endonuclease (patch repair protein)